MPLRSLTFLALLSGCALFVAASGLMSTAIGLHAGGLGLGPDTVGLVMAAYFFGFIVGTYVCPRVISSVGHIRAFSVFAAIAASAAMLHYLLSDVFVWALLRLVTGICLAGLFMVVESWLNEQSTNAVRGRMFAVYQIISLSSLAIGQWFLLLSPTNTAEPFVICGILFALGLVPTALATVTEPAPVPRVRLELGRLWNVSPLAVLGTATAALANSTFFALGPVYASTRGLELSHVAAFMSLVILGGVLLQWPVGHLSDRFERRSVVLAASVGAAVFAGSASLTTNDAPLQFYLSAFLYGGCTFSIYPLCVAYSNDHAVPTDFVTIASGLLLVYGAGATAGPAVAGALMNAFGPNTFLVFLMGAHSMTVVFSLYRMSARPAPDEAHHEPFVMLHRTSQSALTMLPGAEIDEDGR